MRVLHVVNSFRIGGAEKMLVDYANNQNLIESVKLNFLALSGNNNQLSESFKDLKNVRILSNYSEYNPLLIFKLIPIIKEYDIVHIHLFPSLYWVVLAKWVSLSKVRLIYTEHSTQTNRDKYSFFKFIDRFIYSKLKKVVAVSNGCKDALLKRSVIDLSKIKVIQNGVPLKTPQKVTKQNSCFELIQVSRFTYQKDHETLIKSLTYLPNSIVLTLIGDGETKPHIEKLVKELALEDRVNFLGFKTKFDDDINRADVFVLSSNIEGLSLSIIEAMSLNKPIVASEIYGIIEVVKDYGLLFEPKNEKDLAEKILQLYKDHDLYKKIQNQCFNRAKDFSINRHIVELKELYETIVK